MQKQPNPPPPGNSRPAPPHCPPKRKDSCCTTKCMHECLNYAGAIADANHFEQGMKQANSKLTKLVEFVKSLKGAAFTKGGITLDAYIDAALYGLEKGAPHHTDIVEAARKHYYNGFIHWGDGTITHECQITKCPLCEVVRKYYE